MAPLRAWKSLTPLEARHSWSTISTSVLCSTSIAPAYTSNFDNTRSIEYPQLRVCVEFWKQAVSGWALWNHQGAQSESNMRSSHIYKPLEVSQQHFQSIYFCKCSFPRISIWILSINQNACHYHCLCFHGQRCPRWTRKLPSQGSPDGGCMFWDILILPICWAKANMIFYQVWKR